MTTELDTLNVGSLCNVLRAGTANKRRMSPEDLSPPPTPLSPATSPAVVEGTQALFEVRL
jgi:hypothetical protein